MSGSMANYTFDFNPRSREGSDSRAHHAARRLPISIHAPAKGATKLLDSIKGYEMISIHAPAKGATSPSKAYLSIFMDFNPRSREGSDSYWRPARRIRDYFNPRSREGSDGYLRRFSVCALDFNPRSREGSDDDGCEILSFVATISIHAPAKGATYRQCAQNYKPLFQSTLPRRERPSLRSFLYLIQSYFNPRSREGSDGQDVSIPARP